MSDRVDEGGPGVQGGAPFEDPRSGRRLPPPAFPPGRGGPRRSVPREAQPGDLADALISPTDPRPVRRQQEAEEEALPSEIDPKEVRVTGMGDDARLDPLEVLLAEDPPVMEVVAAVNRLAEALRLRGKAALRVTPEMSRFEATLRSYCVGYILGRRAEE